MGSSFERSKFRLGRSLLLYSRPRFIDRSSQAILLNKYSAEKHQFNSNPNLTGLYGLGKHNIILRVAKRHCSSLAIIGAAWIKRGTRLNGGQKRSTAVSFAWLIRLDPGKKRVAIQPVPTGHTDQYEFLIRDLHHGVWEIRRNACEELSTLGDSRAVPHLLHLLHDGVGAVRFSAAEALGKMGDKIAVPALLELLDNPSFGSYGPVIESLASLKAQEAIPYFIRFLRDPDARMRGLAANALMVMTRQFISFKAKGSEEERALAVAQWEAWWEKNRHSITK